MPTSTGAMGLDLNEPAAPARMGAAEGMSMSASGPFWLLVYEGCLPYCCEVTLYTVGFID